MSFTSKNLNHSSRNGMSFIKGATFFFLGISVVMFAVKAFEVTPVATNAVMYIKKVVFTQSGASMWAGWVTGIVLDGAGWNGRFKWDLILANIIWASVLGTDGSGKLIARSLNGYLQGTWTQGGWCIYSGGSVQCTQPQPVGWWYWALSGDNIYNTNSDYVGIGTEEPTVALQIKGNVIIQGNIANNITWNELWSMVVWNSNSIECVIGTNSNCLGNAVIWWMNNSIYGRQNWANILWWSYGLITGTTLSIESWGGNSLLGGDYNTLELSVWGSIIESFKSTGTNSQYIWIYNGLENVITGSKLSLILWAKLSWIEGLKVWNTFLHYHNILLGWEKNGINMSSFSHVIGWKENSINNSKDVFFASTSSSMVQSWSTWVYIVWGMNNTWRWELIGMWWAVGSTIVWANSNIFGGEDNFLQGESLFTINTNASTWYGQLNTIVGWWAHSVSWVVNAIFGWYENTIIHNIANAILGGYTNTIRDGTGNMIVGGHANNVDDGLSNIILGGVANTTTKWSEYSIILGWSGNIVELAKYSVVWWVNAKVEHDSTFVWNSVWDSEFLSQRPRSFIINAPILEGFWWVGINTNDPQVALDVDGMIRTRPQAETTCNANRIWTIFYDTGTNKFRGCTNTWWVDLH